MHCHRNSSSLDTATKTISATLTQQAATLAAIQAYTQNGYKAISKTLALKVQNDQMDALQTRMSIDRQTTAIRAASFHSQVVQQQQQPTTAYSYGSSPMIFGRGRAGFALY